MFINPLRRVLPSESDSVSISIIGNSVPGNPEEVLLKSLQNFQARMLDPSIHGSLGLTDNTVDHPEHYRKDSGLEAIDVIESWDLNFNLGNVIKYVCRAGVKGSDTREEDLNKALWYLSRELENSSK